MSQSLSVILLCIKFFQQNMAHQSRGNKILGDVGAWEDGEK
jgi:hypothetical protein